MLQGRARQLALLLLLIATRAHADGPAAVRATFPDRRWDAVTTADGGLAGAGLATDPASSFYGNPALALEGAKTLRVSGLLLLPHRDDLRAATTDYQDGTGFPAIGEVGARLRYRGLGITAYFAQPHYQHEETRFVGIDPGTSEVTGDPFPRRNEWTSATRYAGLGAAVRLGNGLLLGAAAEGVFLKERYLSSPQVPPASIPADTFDVSHSKAVLGGAFGASYTAAGLVRIGAAYHLAGHAAYDGGGTDDAPKLLLVGARVGRSAGSAVYAGARFLGKRAVDLGDTLSVARSAPARSEYALGFGYADPGGMWDLRIGGGLSPRPSGGDLKLTRFGVAVSGGTEGTRFGLSYGRTSERRATGRSSSRGLVLATVELVP
jgi:hypothetical protein